MPISLPALTEPLSVTYEPSIAVVPQGRKRVELGRSTFIYDSSHFLLTWLDLPVVRQVIEASEEVPYLCFRLKIEISIVGDLLSRSGIPFTERPGVPTGWHRDDNARYLTDLLSRQQC